MKITQKQKKKYRKHVKEQEETEKDIPETETVNEPTEESPEATAGQDAQAEETAQADDDKETKSKTSFFGKKKKDNKLEQQVEELTDRLTRQMAEFDNFRKRTEKEKSQMYEVGAKDIIEKILPVVDNFERGLDAVPEEKKEDTFIQGMEKVYKQFMTVLESVEVKPIEALGNQFDQNFHNAVKHV